MAKPIELSNVTKAYLEEYQRILKKMMQGMTYVTITCSISENFIKQIIPHQVAAIQMSENVLRYTTNIPVQNLALEIIRTHTEMVESLEAIQNRCCVVQNSEYELYEYMCAYKEITEAMFNAMCAPPVSNSININYLREMIVHHQGGIRLAQNVLRFCICQELIPILRCMIQTLCEQLEAMEKLLDSLQNCDCEC
ncbi:DUF305 domain-containing protein [Lysinibacillus sp. HST-98]|jgi:uncharacterized protein (DUF305 family)|uniref:DUF305 domain-containing protein n=1 Tax=Lysinibacillus capsici TaxID=2115968 RepID=A0A2X0Y305_9BACI|nr:MULTISPECIES: DUF305 domain-containing protein [Lysinibacillus]EFI69872.1 hypothetical protein BFZC1_04238 [Lysinibacillus fusiformis ZC1]EKU42657.1 hypothetical protein C518_2385 [Lysinibacillus fusiformis ZB2]AUS88401.1 DUF305 domain-containing protein [Lysinibacillus sp. YS11]KMN38117.1 hypothetical protein VK91_18175 [Lysinibacillus sp. LK3]MBL3732022.1 DUF305 domain-containing protein [Lysinibacillus sp. HST-98]